MSLYNKLTPAVHIVVDNADLRDASPHGQPKVHSHPISYIYISGSYCKLLDNRSPTSHGYSSDQRLEGNDYLVLLTGTIVTSTGIESEAADSIGRGVDSLQERPLLIS